jgi:hypothetical protein
MAFLLSDYSNALHNILLPYIRDNFPKQTILLDQLKRNSGVTFLNNTFYAPMRSTRHSGVTNLANDGNSTLSGTAGIAQANIGVKIMTGAFDISKLAIDATKSSKSAVENALTFQATSLASDFARSANRQFYGDGSGIIGEIIGSVDVGTFTMGPRTASLDDGASIDNYGKVNGDIRPEKYISPGMVIGIGTAAAVKGTVTAVSAGATAGSCTVSMGAGALAANDAIFALDASLEGAGSMEFTGIRKALSSTTGTNTYAGVARNVTGWTPQFGSVSEALSLSRMENSYLSAKEFGQMGDQYAIFMNKTLFKKYGDLLVAMRRETNQTDLLGGWTGLEFAAGAGKVGVFLDYDVPDGEVLILNLDSWTITQVDDLTWLEDPNSNSMLRLANKISYQATMVWFANILCLAPAANGRETQKTG